MIKILTSIKIILIVATATFVSFHTVIFIKSIEPNTTLAWILAGVIEGFLIILAIQKTIISKLLLIPLFCISVLSSSASFVIKNEDSLNQLLNLKTIKQFEIKGEELQKKTEEQRQKAIEQLQKDIEETQKQMIGLDTRYLTKTLERERKLKDLLIQKMNEGEHQVIPGQAQETLHAIDYITPYKALIFLIIVFVLQSVSLYTASHLKNGLGLTEISIETLKKVSTERETPVTESPTEISTEKGKEIDKDKVISLLKSYKKTGKSLSDFSKKIGVSTSTTSKALSYPSYPISDEVFIKIRDGLDRNFNKERG